MFWMIRLVRDASRTEGSGRSSYTSCNILRRCSCFRVHLGWRRVIPLQVLHDVHLLTEKLNVPTGYNELKQTHKI